VTKRQSLPFENNPSEEAVHHTPTQKGVHMAGKNTAVFGIYQTQADAEYAVDALRSDGFRNTDISVLFPDNKGTKDFAVEKNTKAPEGTAAGATTGGVIGGVLG